jgi:DNA-binding transcriptional LysR family regulator
VRIRRTTRAGASPHPISRTTAIKNSVQAGHGWAPPPAVLVYHGLAAALRGLGAELVVDTASSIPLAALRHTATTDGQVRA